MGMGWSLTLGCMSLPVTATTVSPLNSAWKNPPVISSPASPAVLPTSILAKPGHVVEGA
jgi:hypothetical protein